MPRLILHPGRPDQREVRLSPGPNTIGRAEDNTVFVLDRSLSRHHASIDVDEDGGAVLRDLGSTNGTFVDGERASAARLLDGSTITLGRTRIRFSSRTERTEEDQ